MSETPDEDTTEWADYTVTCHTDGCGNSGHAIVITTVKSDAPAVVCGVCSQTITDVTPTT